MSTHCPPPRYQYVFRDCPDLFNDDDALVAGSIRDEVKSVAGSSVSLSCAVNKPRCGDFHSIKWYKENRRVYVYSPVVDFSKEIVNIITRNLIRFLSQLNLSDC